MLQGLLLSNTVLPSLDTVQVRPCFSLSCLPSWSNTVSRTVPRSQRSYAVLLASKARKIFCSLLAFSLWHKDSWLQCTERSCSCYRSPYDTKNQRGSSKIPPNAMVVFCVPKSPLYARAGSLWPKSVSVATPGNSPRHGGGQT